MKTIFFIILFLGAKVSFSQKIKDTSCVKYDSTIKVYIIGGPTVRRSAIENGFSLQCADNSLKIISFHLSYIDTTEEQGKIYSLLSEGNLMPANSQTYFLKNIGVCDFIAIDQIRVLKDGQCFKAKSFICYVSK